MVLYDTNRLVWRLFRGTRDSQNMRRNHFLGCAAFYCEPAHVPPHTHVHARMPDFRPRTEAVMPRLRAAKCRRPRPIDPCPFGNQGPPRDRTPSRPRPPGAPHPKPATTTAATGILSSGDAVGSLSGGAVVVVAEPATSGDEVYGVGSPKVEVVKAEPDGTKSRR